MTRYRRDPSWRQPGDGKVVIAGSPLRLFRISTGGARVLALATTGEQPDTPTVDGLLDRLVVAGALHPLPEGGPFDANDVTVVMPVKGNHPVPPPGMRTIVVDDGSDPPIDAIAGATVIRLESNQGPAAARNAGLDHVTTPLVAFVDADIEVTDRWLEPLLAHFTDRRVALVAPRVAGSPGHGAIAVYEQRHSPLDLGTVPARVAAGTRVSYVPAATIVCHTETLRTIGGFDTDLRVGEDVDLVWRLVAHGHRCRYEPASVVHHRPRTSWFDLLRQRVGYGRSAAPLERRHPGALAPVRMSGWSAGVWALVALRRPWSAVALAGATVVALQRRLGSVPRAESARLVVRGHLLAGRQLAKGITRVWWPLALVAAVAVPRSRVPIAAAVVLPSAVEALTVRSLAPLRDAPMLLADEMAYGAGVWWGVLEERRIAAMKPAFTTWPKRGDG